MAVQSAARRLRRDQTLRHRDPVDINDADYTYYSDFELLYMRWIQWRVVGVRFEQFGQNRPFRRVHHQTWSKTEPLSNASISMLRKVLLHK